MTLSNTDSWLVLGPTRTGSKFVADSIIKTYANQNLILDLCGPYQSINESTKIKQGQVLHMHDATIIQKILPETKIVVTLRDLFDSAVSWCIAEKLDVFHTFREHKHLRRRKVEIDIKDIERHYQTSLIFFKIFEEKIDRPYTILDYDKWKNNDSEIFKLLNFQNGVKSYIIKSTQSHEELVINWSEISEYALTINRDWKNLINDWPRW